MPDDRSRQEQRPVQAAPCKGKHDKPALQGDLAWDAWACLAERGVRMAQEMDAEAAWSTRSSGDPMKISDLHTT